MSFKNASCVCVPLARRWRRSCPSALFPSITNKVSDAIDCKPCHFFASCPGPFKVHIFHELLVKIPICMASDGQLLFFDCQVRTELDQKHPFSKKLSVLQPYSCKARYSATCSASALTSVSRISKLQAPPLLLVLLFYLVIRLLHTLLLSPPF